MNFKQFFCSLFCLCNKDKWQPSVKSYDIIVDSTDKANFLYKTSQEKLQSTIDGHSSLEKKIIIFLSYLISVNTVLAGFIIQKFNFESSVLKQDIPFYWQLTTIFFLFSIIALILISIVKPKKFFYKGNNPENILDEDYCHIDYNRMIVGESILYKERIDYNESIVDKGTYLFNKLLIITIISPILFVFH